jgi:hypothetical protein
MPTIKKEMIGKRFGKLLVIEEVIRAPKDFSPIHYKCICDCGNTTIANGYKLRSGNKSSCGCLQRQSALSKIPKMIFKSTKYSPEQSLAIKVWKKHYDDDGLSFDDFLTISQQNCYYCNSPPFNNLKSKQAQFRYNGLDRINSSLGHIKDNCVACCIICNRGKNDQPYDQAIEWMQRLVRNFDQDKIYTANPILLNNSEISYAKCIYRNIKFKQTDLSFDDFIALSKSKCHYCGGDFSNSYGSFTYNGLDRVDSFIRYLKNNVVPCCKWCNFAKRNLTLTQFAEWINKLKIKINEYK